MKKEYFKFKKEQQMPSINYHLFEPCNMKCKYCFAQFKDVKQILPKGYLPKQSSIKIIDEIVKMGFTKLTFVGGEPTLCNWLPELIKYAKTKGLTTMIVTNGSKITEEWLKKTAIYLDWVGISIDSVNNENNINIGRYYGKNTIITKEQYLKIFDLLKKYKINSKINTVVTKYNYNENFSELINYANPKRWKIFEPLKVKGQNDDKIDLLKPNLFQYNSFVNFHKNNIKNKDIIVPETNSDMTGSYLMIDPAGRFFDNTSGKHIYSKKIIEVGIETALNDINFNYKKFVERGGIYNWNSKKINNNAVA